MNYYVYSDFYQFPVFIVAVQGEMLCLDTIMFWNNATVKCVIQIVFCRNWHFPYDCVHQ